MSFIGPVIPETLLKNQDDNEEETEKNNEDPQPSVSEENSDDNFSYGPALPPDMVEEEERNESEQPNDDDDDDDCVVGPMPQQSNESEAEYLKRLELLRMKELLASAPKKREEWMTELPPQLKNFGLGARTFSRKPIETGEGEDKSIWTDTPLEKMIKSAQGITPEDQAVKPKKKRPHTDEEMEKLTKKLNASRGDSLMTIHQKEKQKSSETLGTRVPFDRDRDLGVSGLGAKDKSKIIENAKELAGRFKHGAGKYDC